MRVLQPQRRLPDEITARADRQRTDLPDEVIKVYPLDKFHDQEVVALDLIGVVSMDDVGMVELGGRLDLALEALTEASLPRRSGRMTLSVVIDSIRGDGP